MKKKIAALAAFALLSASSAAAQTQCSSNSNSLCNPLQSSSVTGLLTDAVDIAIPIGVIIAVLAFIITGFQFIAARGNPEKLSEAKQRFLWIAVGTAILLGAWAIVTVIKDTLVSAGVVNQGVFGE